MASSKGCSDLQTHASTTLKGHHVALEPWGVSCASLSILKDSCSEKNPIIKVVPIDDLCFLYFYTHAERWLII